MLRNLKKTAWMPAEPTHVDLFVEHYDQLRQWALHFSEHNREGAEDLLHDFYLHFTLSKPDLGSIQNLEGYLYIVMRNLHLSQVRRATRTPFNALSVVDYDTVDVSFWASDPRDRIRMREELGAICQYACLRKESSKAGSVLILRFFHGYYPEEIARILCITRPAVKERLRLARAEAKLYLEDPHRLTFIGKKPPKPPKFSAEPAGDLRLELRKTIFNSRQGKHPDAETLSGFYKVEGESAPECVELAHLVSCEICLDKVNALLGIPTLASRYPEDTIGKDPGKKGGSGGAGGGPKMLDSYIRRSNELYHHEPQELCIAVNGHLQGSQRVASEKSEMSLIIDGAETPGFVEVFSEQGIRLLLLNVEPPPNGNAKQSARVELSDGRTLDANLNFSGSFPALQVTYHDPTFALEAAEKTTQADAGVINEEVVSPLAIPLKKSRFTSFLAGWKLWLEPARITAVFAVLIITALLLIKFVPTGTVTAAELLQKSADREESLLANKERALHRTLNLEEYNSQGQVTSRRRIDIWQSAERGITARRLYDEQGRLTMGDWRRSDGIQTIYKRGEAARLGPLPEKRGKAVGFDDVWQLSVSAREFLTLLDNIDQAQDEMRANDYLISYTPQSNNNSNGITKASLVLSKEDLHPIEGRFTLQNAGEIREYRMVEANYEWRPSNSVAPAVFEPNVELTGAPTGTKAKTPALANVSNANTAEETNLNTNTDTNTKAEPATTATLATPALEVKVIELLNKANAFMGEQISVQRTAEGKLQVSGLVETAQRKAELLNALAPVRNNSAVRINIETVAEAQAREARKKKGNTGVQSVDTVQATEGTSPVYNDLRKKFSESEARAFADRVLRRGAQSRRHALAMKQLSERFSITDLQSLNAAERAKWLSLLRGHADKFLAETESLRRELQSVFPDLGGGSSAGALDSDKEIQASVRRLYELAVATDEDLGRSFAVFTNPSGSAEVKSAKFWRTLNTATALARAIQGVR